MYGRIRVVSNVGEAIRKAHRASGLNQEKLAELADMSLTYLAEIERGKRNCSINSIRKISKGLGIKMEALFHMIEDEQKEVVLSSSESKIISHSKIKGGWEFLISISVKEGNSN